MTIKSFDPESENLDRDDLDPEDLDDQEELPPSPAQYDAWLAISQVMSQLEVAFDATTDIDGAIRSLAAGNNDAALKRARAALRRQNHSFGVMAFNLPAIAVEIAGILSPGNEAAYKEFAYRWFDRVSGARKGKFGRRKR